MPLKAGGMKRITCSGSRHKIQVQKKNTSGQKGQEKGKQSRIDEDMGEMGILKIKQTNCDSQEQPWAL